MSYHSTICARLYNPSLGCLLAKKKKFHSHRLILENSVKLLDSTSLNCFPAALYCRGHTERISAQAQITRSPTEFHRTGKPPVYGTSSSSILWTCPPCNYEYRGMRILLLINSSPEFRTVNAPPFKTGVFALRGSSQYLVELLNWDPEKMPWQTDATRAGTFHLSTSPASTNPLHVPGPR
jgi:hypothetical protein